MKKKGDEYELAILPRGKIIDQHRVTTRINWIPRSFLISNMGCNIELNFPLIFTKYPPRTIKSIPSIAVSLGNSFSIKKELTSKKIEVNDMNGAIKEMCEILNALKNRMESKTSKGSIRRIINQNLISTSGIPANKSMPISRGMGKTILAHITVYSSYFNSAFFVNISGSDRDSVPRNAKISQLICMNIITLFLATPEFQVIDNRFF